MRPPSPLLRTVLAVALLPMALGAPARIQEAAAPFQLRLQELGEEMGVLQVAYGALLDEPGRGPEGELSGAQLGRAERLHRALKQRARILRRPGAATRHIRESLEADRAELVPLLWRAVGSLDRVKKPSSEVRELAERWTESARSRSPEATPPAEQPRPDLEELSTRVWILRLARRAHEARGDERSVLIIDGALRYADLRLEDATWDELATAQTLVAPPARLAKVVESAAEHFDAVGEARRARICRRLARFYRGEPQVVEPPLEDDRSPLTEEQQQHLRIAIAAREAHLLAGETASAAQLDRLVRTFRATGASDLRPTQIAGLLGRAAELHRTQGHPRHAASAEALLEELYAGTPSLDLLRARVERLERELEELRRRVR